MAPQKLLKGAFDDLTPTSGQFTAADAHEDVVGTAARRRRAVEVFEEHAPLCGQAIAAGSSLLITRYT